MDDSGDSWLTYAEAGQRLGVSPEAARAKAARKRWRRQVGNDGLARVLLPGDLPVTARLRTPGDRPVTSRSTPGHVQLIKTLESHVESLKAQLATTEARLAGADARSDAADAALIEERAKVGQAIAAFADLAERLEELATERARPWWRRLVS
jgi:hypothetical protein